MERFPRFLWFFSVMGVGVLLVIFAEILLIKSYVLTQQRIAFVKAEIEKRFSSHDPELDLAINEALKQSRLLDQSLEEFMVAPWVCPEVRRILADQLTPILTKPPLSLPANEVLSLLQRTTSQMAEDCLRQLNEIQVWYMDIDHRPRQEHPLLQESPQSLT